MKKRDGIFSSPFFLLELFIPSLPSFHVTFELVAQLSTFYVPSQYSLPVCPDRGDKHCAISEGKQVFT